MSRDKKCRQKCHQNNGKRRTWQISGRHTQDRVRWPRTAEDQQHIGISQRLRWAFSSHWLPQKYAPKNRTNGIFAINYFNFRFREMIFFQVFSLKSSSTSDIIRKKSTDVADTAQCSDGDGKERRKVL